jgi:hypothetical protein
MELTSVYSIPKSHDHYYVTYGNLITVSTYINGILGVKVFNTNNPEDPPYIDVKIAHNYVISPFIMSDRYILFGNVGCNRLLFDMLEQKFNTVKFCNCIIKHRFCYASSNLVKILDDTIYNLKIDVINIYDILSATLRTIPNQYKGDRLHILHNKIVVSVNTSSLSVTDEALGISKYPYYFGGTLLYSQNGNYYFEISVGDDKKVVVSVDKSELDGRHKVYNLNSEKILDIDKTPYFFGVNLWYVKNNRFYLEIPGEDDIELILNNTLIPSLPDIIIEKKNFYVFSGHEDKFGITVWMNIRMKLNYELPEDVYVRFYAPKLTSKNAKN